MPTGTNIESVHLDAVGTSSKPTPLMQRSLALTPLSKASLQSMLERQTPSQAHDIQHISE